ncbi:S-adenosyl-L-methionine-dependent methyltransferases superfamily protein [Rhynchospora pubera]|uniref:Ribosomal RNA-processing protein 8 n=1 Tax=Rhynchospora pubera TaxID=906938 RepID=A0AAV8HAR3_9POAL|nr:S-adenosyl-L-methionine-dependent methyltransferases superfamily protein [Rhynchospora pubera]
MDASSKGKNRRRGKKRRKASNNQPLEASVDASEQTPSSSVSVSVSVSKRRKLGGATSTSSGGNKSTSFLDKMRARLSGGHFRMLNEKLYTCSGKDAFDYFKEDPELFSVYHTGYREQMSHWPEQPVNIIIKWLKSRNTSLTVADFGCGDAKLAKSVKNKVFSIDLVSKDPSVIACDMSQTPLESSSVDVAVFCLSLMGTNYPSYITEANRVLKPGGWLLIAEVKSRFDPNNGGADPEKFSEAVKNLGFSLVSKDMNNKMFILFYFRKKERSVSDRNISWPELKPCIYKRR